MVRRISLPAIAAILLALGAAAALVPSGGVARALSGSALQSRGGEAAATSASGRTIGGQVLYGFRACSSAMVSSQAPVPGAELLLRPATGRAITARLDGRGRFTVVVPNALPVKAWLVLSDSRLSVAPLDPAAGTYRIPLGAIAFHQGRAVVLRRRLVLDSANWDGAANVWRILHQGAAVAAAVSPVRVPAVTARWTYGEDLTAGTTHYDPTDRTIIVGAVPVTTAQAEWEPWALLHEYAHHLLHIVADPGSRGGTHAFNTVHPDQPALPWSEGFANAFAAIAQNDPVIKINCSWKADMSSAPAHPVPSMKVVGDKLVPDPDAQNEAQYNEGAIAGTLWHLTSYLGAGSPVKGLRLILQALHLHPAHSMREFRDALLRDGSLESARNHTDISQIFIAQNIAWQVQVGFDDIDTQASGGECAGCLAAEAIQIVVQGPYGRCTPPPNGGVVQTGYFAAFGDLSYTQDDDCSFFSTSGGEPPLATDTANGGSPTALFDLKLPFKSDESDLQPYSFTVYARWLCSSIPGGIGPPDPPYVCTSSRQFQVTAQRDVSETLNPIQVTANYTFNAGGGLIPIAAFDGQGGCKLLIPPGGDCSA